MKKLLLFLLSAVCLSTWAQTTNFVARTNDPGTRMTVPVTTSRLWRGILPLETGLESVCAMGFTNDAYGYLYSTNFDFRTNLSSDAAILDGFVMEPVVEGQYTNSYWWDFGKVNLRGKHLIYAGLVATNDVKWLGPTNCQMWSLLSFSVLASGGNRTLYVPASPAVAQFFTTNGWSSNSGYFSTVLTNGHLFRLTLQSNVTGLEPLYIFKP